MNRVSVVIVNFNTGVYLTNCVRSVLDSNADIEVFVSDNGSNDNSITLLRNEFASNSRLKIFENGKNLGFSRGNNLVVPETSGDFLLFLNPDCVIHSDTITKMLDVMQHYPSAGMAGCLIRNMDGTVQPTCIRNIPTPWNSLVRVLRLHRLFPKRTLFRGLDLATDHLPPTIEPVSGISGAFMFVRRSALAQVGLMDEKYFLYCEDVDWMMRFQQADWQILFVPSVEIFHAKGISSSTRPLRVIWYKHKGMMYFYHKFFRQKYTWLMMWLVYGGIWLRFLILSVAELIKGKSHARKMSNH
jgi:GT2 family glycosyltransferase